MSMCVYVCAHMSLCVLHYKCMVKWVLVRRELESAAVRESWGEISFTTSMKRVQKTHTCVHTQTHAHAYMHTHMYTHTSISLSGSNSYFSLMSIKSPENSIWQHHARYKNTGKLVMCGWSFQCFVCVWTVILRSYQCSSLVPSSWAGKRRCLTQGDRCHVLNTAPDRLAAGHHSSLLPSLPSTRTLHAHTLRARHTEGLCSPLQRGDERTNRKAGMSQRWQEAVKGWWAGGGVK